MAEIDGDRLIDFLQTLRGFGRQGNGVVRPTFSEADMAARAWLRDQMEVAGLDARIDGVANVVGRSRNTGPALLVGSHSDTQPRGGWLDGALGVAYGVEVARALGSDPETAHLPIDAVAWADEEGTYRSCLGSASFVGVLTDDVLDKTDAAGETVRAAIERNGLTDVDVARFEPDRHIGYLEAHIEQGPFLEEAAMSIGSVTSIVGIRSTRVSFVGEQNHAGTTPMDRRKDAGVALFEFAVRLRRRFAQAASKSTVWTIGNVSLDPGAESIIPGHAELVLQYRDPHDHLLEKFDDIVADLAAQMSAEGPVGIMPELTREVIAATHMDEGLRSHINAAAEQRVPGRWTEMPSAAGHDPMVLSHHMPCAMLFIPSINGISHDFAEDSHLEDIVTGCQVFADAAVSILDAS